jgi:hypothetical protein
MKILRAGFVAVLLATNLFGQSRTSAAVGSCESLGSISLPNVIITSAKSVAAGAFTLPASSGRGGGGQAAQFSKLPAFCRVTATVQPSSDSDIKVEVWMPAFAPGASAFAPSGATADKTADKSA